MWHTILEGKIDDHEIGYDIWKQEIAKPSNLQSKRPLRLS
jgi:hypothetical protein